MFTYKVLAPLSQMAVIQAARRSDKKLLMAFFDLLEDDPFQVGQNEIFDAESDRIYQQSKIGKYVVTHWVDHAAREIRVVNIEKLS